MIMAGFVRLVDSMPRENLDAAVVQAARVSYGPGTKKTSDDRALIRYLMRHRHNTPFEMIEFKFHIKCPIFVARQWMRHRTASVNEISARYSEMPDEFFMPDQFRSQSSSNRQMSEQPLDPESNESAKYVQSYSCVDSYRSYKKLLNIGCGRELARTVLPVSTMTEFYWKINLHNLLHFLELRMDIHAQKEIRDYAVQIWDMIVPLVPLTCEAFMDFRINAVTLTAPEIQAIRTRSLTVPGVGENAEFQVKKIRVGIS
jgi:thymidylate synthase (FAD)